MSDYEQTIERIADEFPTLGEAWHWIAALTSKLQAAEVENKRLRELLDIREGE